MLPNEQKFKTAEQHVLTLRVTVSKSLVAGTARPQLSMATQTTVRSTLV